MATTVVSGGGDSTGGNIARAAIAQKAADTARLLGASTSDVQPITAPGALEAFAQRFQFGTVYYSLGTGAHEVNGEINAHYDALGGPGASQIGLKNLGLPITDEKLALDEPGTPNHEKATALSTSEIRLDWNNTASEAGIYFDIEVSITALRIFGPFDAGKDKPVSFVVCGLGQPKKLFSDVGTNWSEWLPVSAAVCLGLCDHARSSCVPKLCFCGASFSSG